MKKVKKWRTPVWVESALQGICYWIGYKHCYYWRHKVGESAIIAELWGLICNKLSKVLFLHCEAPFNEERIDLTISKSKNKEDLSSVVEAIEVKRGANSALIQKDIDKLLKLKIKYPKVMAFVLVADTERPRVIVNENGYAIKEQKKITLILYAIL